VNKSNGNRYSEMNIYYSLLQRTVTKAIS